ncbi:MAG: hypothetical protein WC631_01535 [Candidatus Paceibacterota bacterium]|jgi:hypothetical protein
MKENIMAWLCMIMAVLVWVVLSPLFAFIVSYVLAGITAYLIFGYKIAAMKKIHGCATMTVMVIFGYVALWAAFDCRKKQLPPLV